MLMAEIRLDSDIYKGLYAGKPLALNIGELTNDERVELIRRYEALHGEGSLKLSASVLLDQPIPDVRQPPKTDGMPNAAFLQYQYELIKEILTLADEVRQDTAAKKYG